MTDLMNAAWRGDLTRMEISNETHFVGHTKGGYATNFTVMACEPLCRRVFTMENGSAFGIWVEIFETAEGGARLTYIETVNAKH